LTRERRDTTQLISDPYARVRSTTCNTTTDTLSLFSVFQLPASTLSFFRVPRACVYSLYIH
jgi:hypothetical protein